VDVASCKIHTTTIKTIGGGQSKTETTAKYMEVTRTKKYKKWSREGHTQQTLPKVFIDPYNMSQAGGSGGS
jgi:hypothetical protein